MFSVCSTAPMDGIARYASRCSALFHMNVPTRWSPSTPSERSAFASRAVRSPTAAYVRRRDGSSPAQVTTSLSPNTVVPYRMIAETVSWKSIIVLSTADPPPREVPLSSYPNASASLCADLGR